MKAIVNTGPGALELRELPAPIPGPGQALIRTAFCSICATDLKMIAGWERTGFPSIPGHEWSGVVEAVGPGADGSLVDRPCVAENVLSDGGEVGFEHPGGYGELFLTEARNVLPLPAGLDLAAAPLVEPLSVCVHALERLGRPVSAGEPVLVSGDGAIGLLLTMALAAKGCRSTTLVGGRSGRLALAAEFGAARTLNYHALSGDFARAVAAAAGRKFPVVFEASGSPDAVNACLDLVEPLGTMVVIGDYGAARTPFPWNTVRLRQVTILGTDASAGAWPQAVGLAPRLPLARLASRRLPAECFAEGMALVRSRDPSIVKVVLEW
ncbi:MAG: zinc-binding dehydrogenase [Spirochaetes bacterium]|nr:zinc-binding dehydrogenase [Spirochaetota bacterium]